MVEKPQRPKQNQLFIYVYTYLYLFWEIFSIRYLIVWILLHVWIIFILKLLDIEQITVTQNIQSYDMVKVFYQILPINDLPAFYESS